MNDTNLQLPSCEFAEIVKVDVVNASPDIFTIGPEHVVYAADENGGQIDKTVIDKIPCHNCKRPYREHTFQLVAFIKLKRFCTNAEMTEFIKSIPRDENNKAIVGEDKVDGFVFVETPEKYRILVGQENS